MTDKDKIEAYLIAHQTPTRVWMLFDFIERVMQDEMTKQFEISMGMVFDGGFNSSYASSKASCDEKRMRELFIKGYGGDK